MVRPPAGALVNLFTATKATGHNQGRLRRGAHSRQQYSFTALDGYFVVLAFLETERAGHSAATAVEDFKVQAHAGKEFLLAVRTHDGSVMTMQVDDGFLLKLRNPVISGGLFL